jgi:hypothetical protein
VSLERAPGKLLVLGLLASLVAQACYPSTPDPSPPPPLTPTIIGVVDHVEAHGAVMVLTDGRSVEVPENSDVQLMGGIPEAGDLVLSSTVAPKFFDSLKPIGNAGSGCWEAWDNPVAWDMGATIRFSYGIELPKAEDFQAPASTMLYGHLGWAASSTGLRWSFCANSSGQIEWGTPP